MCMGDEEADEEMEAGRREDGDEFGVCEGFMDFTEKRLKENTKKAYAALWRIVVDWTGFGSGGFGD